MSAALAASEAELRGMFEGAGTGISITTPNGAFVRANPAYCAMLGYTEAELSALDVEQVLHPADRAGNAAAVAQLLSGEHDRIVSEKRCLTKLGHTVWVRTSLAVVRGPNGDARHLVANAEDVTERVLAEERLARSESLSTIAGSVAHVGGWAYELATGAVFWSDGMHALTGFPPGHVPGFPELLEGFPLASRQQLLGAVETCRTTGTAYDLELEFTTYDGREIWARCVGEAGRDAEGVIVQLHGAMQDITLQRQATLEVAQLAERLTVTMESITDALFTLDDRWRFTYLNAQAERLLQRSARSLLGHNIWREFPEAVGSRLADGYRRAVEAQSTVTVDDFFYEPLDLWIEARAFPAPDGGLTVYFRDISRRRAAEDERHQLLTAERAARQEAEQVQAVLAHKASHDPLTGLHNRNEITARLAAARPEGHTVLLVDLDGFKRVNDGLGRTTGDELLMSVAYRLRELVGADDTLARTGDDQFTVLVPDRHVAAADRTANRILGALRTPLPVAGHRLYVTASIGIADAAPDRAPEEVLRDAELALDLAKHEGRNRSAWYDPILEYEVDQRLATAAELHDALGNDQLVLHYQPSFDLATAAPVGAEALARWQHPERGLVPPGLFIPVAEDTGLIEPLGDWCLATALVTARPWTTRDATFTIWANVAVPQLRRPGLAAKIGQLLAASGTPPHQLGIEITESAFAVGVKTVRTELDAIARLGVQIAIDDFGTGYSSLSRLASLPVHVLKIDRSFIDALDTPAGVATVTAIVDLGHAIDARIVAEGVETHEQLAILRDAGCDHASGFLLARPDLPERLTANCTTGRVVIETLDASRSDGPRPPSA